jgi:hypothetical protein
MMGRHHHRADKTPRGWAWYGRWHRSHHPQEDTEVLPPPCDRMDHHTPGPRAALTPITRPGLGAVAPGAGVGALLGVDRRQDVPGHVAAPERRRRASAVARVRLCGDSPGRDRAPSAGRRDGLWAVVGRGRGPVGGHPMGPGPGGDDAGPPLDRVGAPRGLAGLGHPGGLDAPGGPGHPCLAPGVGAPGAPGAPRRLDGPWPGGAGFGRPLAVAAPDAAGVAPVVAPQHWGHVSSHGAGARGPSADVGARARDAVAGPRQRRHRPPPAAARSAAGVLGRGRHRSLVAPDRAAAGGQHGRLVGLAGLEGAGLQEPPARWLAVAAAPEDHTRAGRAPVAGRRRGTVGAAACRGGGGGDDPRQHGPRRHSAGPRTTAAAAGHPPAAGACLAPGLAPEPGGVARAGPAAPGRLCPRTLASGAGAAAPIPARAGAAPGRVQPQAAGAIGTCMRVKTWGS